MKIECNFVAINYIDCNERYKVRFVELFDTRVRAIDAVAGFKNMQVLKPRDEQSRLLIGRFEDSEVYLKTRAGLSEFIEGHKRRFADIVHAKQERV
jgi:heme-degrading monooxygenase HmoA